MPLRESGTLVKSPNFFLKSISFVNEYKLQKDGVSVPSHIECIVDTRIAGRADLNIHFSNLLPRPKRSARKSPVLPKIKTSMRTLFLNPPSFEGFDGGAGSRWPSTREIESYWYPVWLCYPAGMLPDSKVLDAPPHGVSIEQTVAQAKDFELLVLFTSSPGFHVDVKIAEMMKDANPKMQVCFVGPPVTIEPDKVLNATKAIDFIVRREFDHQIVDLRQGHAAERAARRQLSRRTARTSTIPKARSIENLDELPWVTKVYKRDLDFKRYNVPFLLNPYISFYTTRGCPAMCTFCLWPQTHSGHRWRLRSAQDIANEVQVCAREFPGPEGNLLRRRYLQLPQGAHPGSLRGAEEAETSPGPAPRA